MSGEIEIQGAEHTDLFKEVLVREVETVLEQVKTLNLNKVKSLEHIEELMQLPLENLSNRLSYLQSIDHEKKRLEKLTRLSEGRTGHRDMTSLQSLTKPEPVHAEEKSADK